MTGTPHHACQRCTRTDLSLTANGRIRSHAANGKRPGPENPNCPGGSDWPKHDHDYAPAGTSGWVCTVCGDTGPFPQHDVDAVCPGCGCSEHAGFCTACGCLDNRTEKSSGPNPYRAPLPTGNLPHDRHTDASTEDDPWQTRSTHPTTAAAPDPGSTPATTATVTGAVNPSAKETSSAQTATAGTRDRTAAVTTETAAPVADAFDSAPAAKPEPKRDRYGRYMLPHPATGKKQAWTRATTMAKSISDTFALSQWSQRMVAKGLAMRPDLASLAYSLDVKQDKDKLNNLVDQAKDAAGQKIAANLGTSLHTFTENVDGGAPLESVPPQHRADVSAYRAAMEAAGLVAVPHLIERITVVPQFDVAGTFDRILLTSDGDHVIGDVKSGRTLEYGWQEIAIQLALYAQGVNESGVYDMERGLWLPPQSYGDSIETGSWYIPKVRTDYGIVMHLPVGESVCTLYRVDLVQGWAAATLCASVRTWRKTRNLAEPYAVAEADGPTGAGGYVAPVSVRPPTWAERFGSVSSRGEAMALYSEALAVLGQGSELNALVRTGMAVLAALEERAG